MLDAKWDQISDARISTKSQVATVKNVWGFGKCWLGLPNPSANVWLQRSSASRTGTLGIHIVPDFAFFLGCFSGKGQPGNPNLSYNTGNK